MDHNNPPKPNDDHQSHHHRRNPNLSINKLSHKITKPSLDPPPPPPPPINPNPPPVYNISKSDFRTMVQKLTGAAPPPSELSEVSRAHHVPPKPPTSSRLHRIRPPPLAQLRSESQTSDLTLTNIGLTPLSPLPPLPSVHAAVESPISAYMRHLRESEPRRSLSGFSPRWRSAASEDLMPHPPLSPLGFGCLPSPKSPNLLLSPTAGQLGFPLSPTGKP